jgi:hypothetical protein
LLAAVFQDLCHALGVVEGQARQPAPARRRWWLRTLRNPVSVDQMSRIN